MDLNNVNFIRLKYFSKLLVGSYSVSNLQVRAFLQPPMEGVVIQTYGAGRIRTF